MTEHEDLEMAIRLLHVWSAWSGTPGYVEHPARKDPLYPRHPDNMRGLFGNEGAMRSAIARLLKRYPYSRDNGRGSENG